MEGNGEGPGASPIDSLSELDEADSEDVDDIGDFGNASTEHLDKSSASCAVAAVVDCKSTSILSFWLTCAWLIFSPQFVFT